MHDPEDENDAIFVDHVIHDSVLTNPEAVERIRDTPDGLHLLATDTLAGRRLLREPLERLAKPGAHIIGQLPEGPGSRRCQLDLIGRQRRSRSRVVRPAL
jgi:phage FluMu protein gp41